MSIDRRAVVGRHDIRLTEPGAEHVVSVGNGDFAFTADITGLQTFTSFHHAGAARPAKDGPRITNTCTMATWGWHETPNVAGYTLADAMSPYDSRRGPVDYPDRPFLAQMASIMMGGGPTERADQAGFWLIDNPHRIDLGRIGLELRASAGAEPETDPGVLDDVEQHVDLWRGVITSRFTYLGEPVDVVTVASATASGIAFRVTSPLLATGQLAVRAAFPPMAGGFSTAHDWSRMDGHTTTLAVTGPTTAIVHRTADATAYDLHVRWSSGTAAAAGHQVTLSTDEPSLDVVATFVPISGPGAKLGGPSTSSGTGEGGSGTDVGGDSATDVGGPSTSSGTGEGGSGTGEGGSGTDVGGDSGTGEGGSGTDVGGPSTSSGTGEGGSGTGEGGSGTGEGGSGTGEGGSGTDVGVTHHSVPELVEGPVGFDDAVAESTKFWEAFWLSGAAIDTAGSTDPRAAELERRVVQSQYLTRVHGGGLTPPQETGFVTNSWQGKFHLEMHWWHSAHFALWGRPELLENQLSWYESVHDRARATATQQGYAGARWPKQVGPDGREAPSDIGALLIWQQPHLMSYADLLHAAYAHDPERQAALVTRLAPLLEETASFMADYADEVDGVFHLGPPVMPAQEFYAARETIDPTFELAYWWYGLEVAQVWRERRGLDRNVEWQQVQDRLAKPLMIDGRYAAVGNEVRTRPDDHPSMLMAYGFVPPTPLIDGATVRRTLDWVLENWEWDTAWGWDFPVMAMTAARVGDGEAAVDVLLRDAIKNHYDKGGHNPQMGSFLPLYLPGNGGVLAAVALMVAGWAGGPDRPGIPTDGSWVVQHEGFVPWPTV
jgi:hypothetical protein